jgi:sugar O-acyltransferase (sialic acid O-acetyltransferase NeuD family)
MPRLFGLFGTGGFAREVMPLARAALGDWGQVRFVQTVPEHATINGIPVISEAEFIAAAGEKKYAIAIADAGLRRAIAERMEGIATACSLQATHVFMGDANSIADGAILCPFTSITANARIGKHFHANIYSYVGHDCVIGDYVTFAPNVHCNGNIHIGNGAYIGTGAIIRQGTTAQPLTIGEGAVIGMGAVVTKPVPAGVTVVGNPARVLEKN